MDIAQLRIRLLNKVKDFDLMKSIMADVEEWAKSRNDAKLPVSGSLPPTGFIQSAQELRSWIANNDDISDADYDTCRRALNELTRIINDALKRRQISH